MSANSENAPGLSDAALSRAADAVRNASALLITAGAGMSADSGLPTFRDEDGLWRINAPLETAGVTPNSFDQDPAAAWGFTERQRRRYRDAVPHAGYKLLHEWAESMPHGFFVYTSNVDELFQRAGFSETHVVECHGSLSWLQCQERCSDLPFRLTDDIQLDADTGSACPPLPACPTCGALARPNVLLFYDLAWIGTRMNEQHDRMDAWLAELPHDSRLTVLELGAGTAVPSVRVCGERAARQHAATLIRINPHEAETDGVAGIGLPLAALQALEMIGDLIGRGRFEGL